MKLNVCDAAAMNMPNNRIVVWKSLEYTKESMVMNRQYHKHYSQFMINMIKEDDAEQVHSTDIENGNYWYTLHHGIYHHNKSTQMSRIWLFMYIQRIITK